MRQIVYLIRHGHTAGTEQNIMYGATELPITEEGLREIHRMAAQEVYPDPQDAILYTSGMLRTEQTFEAIYGDAEHSVEPLLREINFGKFEMMTIDEILNDDYGKAWLRGEIGEPEFEGGDSIDGFRTRVSQGLREIIQEATERGVDRIIAVIHGGVMSYLMQSLFPDAMEDMWEWTPFPGCGYSIELQDDIPVSWGTIGICGGMGHPVRSKKND
ncbi:MAG: phosphoglycerate mutase family protein [Clostridiales bacterium]|nr:phosphoglycerate mutase family protein [Clostridiales bacterium]